MTLNPEIEVRAMVRTMARVALASVALASAMGAVGCGGKDKPPMTPDSPDITMSGLADGGSNDVPSTSPAAPNNPTK